MSLFTAAFPLGALIQSFEHGEIIAQRHQRQEIEHEIHGIYRNPYRRRRAEGDKSDEKAERRVRKMDVDAVPRLQNEPAQIRPVVGALQLILMKIRETAQLRDPVLPFLDPELLIEFSFFIRNMKHVPVGGEPLFGQSSDRERFDPVQQDDGERRCSRGQRELQQGRGCKIALSHPVAQYDQDIRAQDNDRIQHSAASFSTISDIFRS